MKSNAFFDPSQLRAGPSGGMCEKCVKKLKRNGDSQRVSSRESVLSSVRTSWRTPTKVSRASKFLNRAKAGAAMSSLSAAAITPSRRATPTARRSSDSVQSNDSGASEKFMSNISVGTGRKLAERVETLEATVKLLLHKNRSLERAVRALEHGSTAKSPRTASPRSPVTRYGGGHAF